MPSIRDVLGLQKDPGRIFEAMWERHGFRALNSGFTPSIQSMFYGRPENLEKARGHAQRGIQKWLGAMEIKQVTSATVTDAVPIAYDPEILDILRKDAPLLARLPQVGYRGYSVRTNVISARAAPRGWVSEANSLDLSAVTNEFTLAPTDYDMKIFVDAVNVGDFAERGGEGGYIPIRETALGARVAEYSQYKEQAILYGDHSQALTDGSPGDANVFDGMSVHATTGATAVDKSAVNLGATDALLKDIKAEVKDLLQNANVSKGDLEIWTSHTLFDELENEMQVRAIIDQNQNSFNYGFEVIYISGIPVIASHNVAEHTYDALGGAGGPYTIGSEGDVFIVNKRASYYASLAPLFVLPLGRIGLAEHFALGEYGTYIDRAGGRFGKWLYGYAI
ncbi:MAG: hypothetical protein QMD46_12250 [Methanomicrobiales archaeon]|nr:hypothetical protein [Methanomicrobiales archaeon]